MAIDPTNHSSNILAQILEPLEEYLTLELAQKIADLRATPDLQARIDELADKCNEGELTPKEAAEYDSFVDVIDVISVLKTQARDVLKTHDTA